MIREEHKELLKIFSTPVFITQFNSIDMKNINDVLNRLRKSGLGEERKYGWKSPFDLMNLPDLDDLTKQLLIESNNALDNYGVQRDSIEINNMWAQISSDQDYHEYHSHPNSFFSGILYLNNPEGSADTILHNTALENNFLQFPIKEYTDINSESWHITPKTGKLIIFPSWVPHSVRRSDLKVDDERTTLSFTIMIRGENKNNSVALKI